MLSTTGDDTNFPPGGEWKADLLEEPQDLFPASQSSEKQADTGTSMNFLRTAAWSARFQAARPKQEGFVDPSTNVMDFLCESTVQEIKAYSDWAGGVHRVHRQQEDSYMSYVHEVVSPCRSEAGDIDSNRHESEPTDTMNEPMSNTGSLSRFGSSEPTAEQDTRTTYSVSLNDDDSASMTSQVLVGRRTIWDIPPDMSHESA